MPQSIDRAVPIFADVPSQSAEEVTDSGANMLYNGDIKGEFGWVQFNGEPATRAEDSYRDGLCLVVGAGLGVKTQWLMPVPESLRV